MNYFQLSRSARYSILFALPLLLLYELLAFLIGGNDASGVRNGADVLLKSFFVSFGGRNGLLVFDLLLLAVGGTLVWRDRNAGGPLRPTIFATMLGESIALALMFGVVVGILTTMLLRVPAALAVGGLSDLGLGTQLRLSLATGI